MPRSAQAKTVAQCPCVFHDRAFPLGLVSPSSVRLCVPCKHHEQQRQLYTVNASYHPREGKGSLWHTAAVQ